MTHLDIEWSKGRGVELTDLPNIPHVSFIEEELENDEFSARGTPPMSWRDDAPVLFERFQLREDTEYFIDITLPDNQVSSVTEEERAKGWPFDHRLSTVFRSDPPRRWRSNPDGTTTISGLLRLRSHAGLLDLSLGRDAQLVAEVVCRKIGYLEEFKTLLDDVAEEFTELLLQYDSPVSASFNLSDVAPENEAALLFQLRHIMAEKNLPVALDELRRSFHSHLKQSKAHESIVSVREPDFAAFIEEFDPSTVERGGPLASLFRGYTPRDFPVIETHETPDTPENRYVKFFLEELLLIAQRLGASLQASGRSASQREVNSWITSLDEELSSGRWRGIGQFRNFPSNSQVLQKRRGYREILKFDLSLRMSLELPWKRAEYLADGLVGDIRPVSELYEYWCFFKLRRTLVELAEAELPSDGSLIDRRDGGLQIRLLKGKRSRVSYLYKRNDAHSLKLNLFYNRRFSRPTRELSTWHGSYTAQFDPDFSIEIIVERGGGIQRHWLHFDAKYRLDTVDFENINTLTDAGEEREPSDYEVELTRIHRQDDLFKMHTYRDGILSSRGAYILFPGNGAQTRLFGKQANLFVRHPSSFGSSPSYLFPSVGAFDLCPGRDRNQEQTIRDFIVGILDALYQGEPYQEETALF
ncbi:DUF2357 domain-containing protein [Rhizobium bangladeshense]|uniref:DUF2357 domain-containing protein n=1 Tax=Rhizobium bangladeshense TaxID=1138189 RepID=UPI001C82CBC7|nr:DUF2357 domain-containing protein [Rhizobium bangladeshense]MBX4876966.1 DUF2357 domain-containing protein [Rhizobium bangladeshense]